MYIVILLILVALASRSSLFEWVGEVRNLPKTNLRYKNEIALYHQGPIRSFH